MSLESYSVANDLVINTSKTKMMKLGREGPPAAGDLFQLAGAHIERVRHFFYLGIEHSDRCLSFLLRVPERTRKAKQAFASIPNPRRLSLTATISLFDLKIAPVAANGIQILWKSLTQAQLVQVDKVKTASLKVVLGLHQTARNRLVLQLANTRPLTAELFERLKCEETKSYSRHMESWRKK